jgi:membrane-associated protease RseP (regulator of RpoE activity)
MVEAAILHLIHWSSLWGPLYYPAIFHDVAEAIYHFENGVKVYYVHPDSPGARANIISGDTIVSVDGQRLRRAKDWGKFMKKIANPKGTVVLTVRNSTGQHDILVAFVPVVPYSVMPHGDLLLTSSDRVNAYADGNDVYILRGMLRVPMSDEELAFVIGHELAHNCLRYIRKIKWGGCSGQSLMSFFTAVR